MGHVLRVIGVERKGSIRPIRPAWWRWRSCGGDCVEAKEALSSETTVTIPVLLPTLRTRCCSSVRSWRA